MLMIVVCHVTGPMAIYGKVHRLHHIDQVVPLLLQLSPAIGSCRSSYGNGSHNNTHTAATWNDDELFVPDGCDMTFRQSAVARRAAECAGWILPQHHKLQQQQLQQQTQQQQQQHPQQQHQEHTAAPVHSSATSNGSASTHGSSSSSGGAAAALTAATAVDVTVA
jgi:hypothetical protein